MWMQLLSLSMSHSLSFQQPFIIPQCFYPGLKSQAGIKEGFVRLLMSLKRRPQSRWLPCEGGQLGFGSFPLFFYLLTSTIPRRSNSSFAAARKCCSGGASVLPVRCVLLMLMTGSPRGMASHTHRLWSPRVRRVRLGEGCAGERSVNDCTLSATERQLPTWTWCECRAGMRSGTFEGRSQPVFRGLPF